VSQLLSHLSSHETFGRPGIDDTLGVDLFALSFVAEVDAETFDDRRVAIGMLVGHALGAINRSGDSEPLPGHRILDRVTLLDFDERHLFCGKFRAHNLPRCRCDWLPTTACLGHPKDYPGTGRRSMLKCSASTRPRAHRTHAVL
jgi:hypothetical protein